LWFAGGLGVVRGDGEMNRRTFLTLPLLGFAASVAKPVYGGMDLASKDDVFTLIRPYSGQVIDYSYEVDILYPPFHVERVWRNGKLVAESEGK
jgi:hypothetical protein